MLVPDASNPSEWEDEPESCYVSNAGSIAFSLQRGAVVISGRIAPSTRSTDQSCAVHPLHCVADAISRPRVFLSQHGPPLSTRS